MIQDYICVRVANVGPGPRPWEVQLVDNEFLTGSYVMLRLESPDGYTPGQRYAVSVASNLGAIATDAVTIEQVRDLISHAKKTCNPFVLALAQDWAKAYAPGVKVE